MSGEPWATSPADKAFRERINACHHSTADIARAKDHVCACGIKWKQAPYIPQGGPGGWSAVWPPVASPEATTPEVDR